MGRASLSQATLSAFQHRTSLRRSSVGASLENGGGASPGAPSKEPTGESPARPIRPISHDSSHIIWFVGQYDPLHKEHFAGSLQHIPRPRINARITLGWRVHLLR